MKRRTSLKLLTAIAFAVAISFILFGRAGLATPSPADQQTADEADYVGADTCKMCHPDKFRQVSRTAHFITFTSSKWKVPDKGCEACHGPGRKHVRAGGGRQGIFNFKSHTAKEVAERCLRCHKEQQERQGFHQNLHDIDTVACNDCHLPHQEKRTSYILIDNAPKLCLDCHREIRQEFNKPFHHRVLEGGINCSDCHRQHGNLSTTQAHEVSGGNEAACLKCHADKRGPFTFEHGPAKIEGCMQCHVPHGSINNRMLKRSQVIQLCLECHAPVPGTLSDGPGGFHDITSPRFKNCTSCHVEIHGSNTSRLFFSRSYPVR